MKIGFNAIVDELITTSYRHIEPETFESEFSIGGKTRRDNFPYRFLIPVFLVLYPWTVDSGYVVDLRFTGVYYK